MFQGRFSTASPVVSPLVGLCFVAGAQLGPENPHLLVQAIGQLTKRERRVAQQRNLFFHPPKRILATRQFVTI